MVGSEDLLHQISEIEREIDSLLQERDGLDLVLRSAELDPSLPRRLYIRFTIRGLCQRLVRLKLRRGLACHAYEQLQRDEARRQEASVDIRL